jgi:hypothetical protein
LRTARKNARPQPLAGASALLKKATAPPLTSPSVQARTDVSVPLSIHLNNAWENLVHQPFLHVLAMMNAEPISATAETSKRFGTSLSNVLPSDLSSTRKLKLSSPALEKVSASDLINQNLIPFILIILSWLL